MGTQSPTDINQSDYRMIKCDTHMTERLVEVEVPQVQGDGVMEVKLFTAVRDNVSTTLTESQQYMTTVQ